MLTTATAGVTRVVLFVLVVAPHSLCATHPNDQRQFRTQDKNSVKRIMERFLTDIENHRTIMGPVAKDDKRSSSCKCRCRDRYRPGQWRCCSCTWTQKSCFPASVYVTSPGGQRTRMEDLKVGDVIATVSGDGKTVASEVLGFLHRETTQSGLYLTFTTAGGQEISLSPSHLLFASRRNVTDSMEPRFAEEILEGDFLFLVDDMEKPSPKEVIKITTQILKGIYVPLTSTGTLLVNGVVASCYASVSHGIAHAAMAPLRWFPWLLDNPNLNGVQPYVKLVKQIGMYVLPDCYKSPKYRRIQNLDRRISIVSEEHLQYRTNVSHTHQFEFMNIYL